MYRDVPKLARQNIQKQNMLEEKVSMLPIQNQISRYRVHTYALWYITKLF